MLGQLRSCCAIAIVVSLIVAPSGALAAGQTAAQPIGAAQSAAPVSPWLTLSAMTSTSSEATAAAAAQQENVEGAPPTSSLSVIMSTIALAIWILLEDHDGDFDLEPISP